jgi:hypothetical protein
MITITVTEEASKKKKNKEHKWWCIITHYYLLILWDLHYNQVHNDKNTKIFMQSKHTADEMGVSANKELPLLSGDCIYFT